MHARRFPPASARNAVFLVATTVLVWLVALTGTARAHTELAVSDPPDGASIEAPVETIELTFTRPIELFEDSVEIDGGTAEVVSIDRSDDGTVVTARLRSPLGPGRWTVDWRILAEDSHPREGEIDFRVEGTVGAGRASAAAPIADETVAPAEAERSDAVAADRGEPTGTAILEVAAAVARIVMYLGMMAAVGLTLFKAWPHRGQHEGAPALARWTVVAATIALAASFAEVAAHVGTVSGRGLAGVAHAGTWRSVLRTGLGTALVVRSAGLGLLAVGGAVRLRRALPSGPDLLKLTGAGLAIASFQFVGHTASQTPPVVVRTSDAVHAIAAATWIGGLVGLAILSHHGVHRGRAVAAGRFSTAATGAVIAVAFAGIALAVVNLPTIDAAWSSGYGLLLLAKLAFVGVLAAIGAYNHLRVVPQLSDDDDVALARLRHTVTAEVVLAVVIVGLTALLVNATPPPSV